MNKLINLKKEKLEKEIILLKHYTNSSIDTDDLYIRIEHAKNKTLIAEKEFSLAEITGKQAPEKRKILHEEEQELLNQVEILLSRSQNEFPVGEFIRQRIPNFKEASRPALTKSSVEVLLPDALKNAANPTAKAFVRDGTKIFDAIWKWNVGQQVGYSKYFFDDFLLVGTLLKISCKISLIFGLKGSVPLPLADISRASNYVCEVPSRLLTSISRLHQDTFSTEERSQQSLIDKINFAYKHLTSDMGLEAIYSSISKTITTDFLGSISGKIFMMDKGKTSKIHFIDYLVNKLGIEEIQMLKPIDNLILTYITPSLNSLIETFSSLNKISDFSTPHFLNSFIQQLLKTFHDTYTLTPPARIVEDLPGMYRKSDMKKTEYISTKFEHLIYDITHGYVDTKKNYGISDTLEKLFLQHDEKESTLEKDIASLSAEIEMIKDNLPQTDITEELAQDTTQLSAELGATSHDEL